ncbi:MAG: YceI family protein [Chloroflexi bacterium]|nr:YceI family protein [Chloroflexota bacterium]
MPRNLLLVVAGVIVAGLLTVSAVAAFVLRAPATPSGDFTAIPVAPTDTESADPTTTTETATETPQPTPISAELITAELVQADSQARFIINEVLDGRPNTVVGVTDQVAAQILIDPANPANVQMGPVQLNARTLVTDSGNRNRAIQNIILETGTYEFITFTPKSFVGLPETGAVGDTFVFQIVGDLTIRDETHEVTFDATVTVDSDTRMHGLATASILRSTFNLNVPDVPFVASVDQSLALELEFVAEAVQ